MNQIIIHGRLVDDVAERDYTTKEGDTKKMSTLTLAVDQRWGDNTNYFDCAAFGKTADLLATHFHKGQEIVVRGEMNSRTVDKDGTKRKYWTVNIDQFDFCGSKADNDKKAAGDSFEKVDQDVPF